MKRKQRSDKGRPRGAYRTTKMPQFIGTLPSNGKWQLGTLRGCVVAVDENGTHPPYVIINDELKPLLPQ